jgi:hypothetical protein
MLVPRGLLDSKGAPVRQLAMVDCSVSVHFAMD